MSIPGGCNKEVFERVSIPADAAFSGHRLYEEKECSCWKKGSSEWCEFEGDLYYVPIVQSQTETIENYVVPQDYDFHDEPFRKLLELNSYCPIKELYSFVTENVSYIIDFDHDNWFDGSSIDDYVASACIDGTLYGLTDFKVGTYSCKSIRAMNCSDHWIYDFGRVQESAHLAGNVPCGPDSRRERCDEHVNDQWSWYVNQYDIVLQGCKKYPEWSCKEFDFYRRQGTATFGTLCR
ncbi:hypothetical protein GEMRC1_003110 [Eukaryota sp. GEM-RC1]